MKKLVNTIALSAVLSTSTMTYAPKAMATTAQTSSLQTLIQNAKNNYATGLQTSQQAMNDLSKQMMKKQLNGENILAEAIAMAKAKTPEMAEDF